MLDRLPSTMKPIKHSKHGVIQKIIVLDRLKKILSVAKYIKLNIQNTKALRVDDLIIENRLKAIQGSLKEFKCLASNNKKNK